MESLLHTLVSYVEQFGYLGLYILSAIESTFVPLPSELVVVPAGYIAFQGKMNFWAVWGISTAGTLTGALINYYLGVFFGRRLLQRYGKYMFLDDEKLAKSEEFFRKHGAFSMFTGRLIPGVRHYIPFPAGVARMNVWTFSVYTLLGGAVWMMVLTLTGYHIGANQENISKYLLHIKLVTVGVLVVLGGLYFWRHRRKTQQEVLK